MLVVIPGGKAPQTGWNFRSKGGLSAAQRLPGADPEGDGLTNLQEYSFALNSLSAAGGSVTQIEVETSSGQDYALFSYRQAANVKRVEFLVQTSTDLKTWSIASNAVAAGGVDMGSYIKRRVRVPIATPAGRTHEKAILTSFDDSPDSDWNLLAHQVVGREQEA